MLQSIYYILFLMCLIYGLYFGLTGLVSFFKKTEAPKKQKAKTKFGILIAARNEAEVLPDLIGSLKKQNYPKDLYDILVIVNNCTDNTEEVAIKCGAKALCVDIPVKTKGEVLVWTKNKLKDSDYDAYIVFDADNIVHKDFLARMNDVYLAGYKVAQGFRDSKNINDNWISSSYSIFYYIQNFFFNKSRMIMNLSASINGTGFMARKDFFEKYFKPKTLTEDVEFAALCTLADEKVYFAEEAITYDEHTTSFRDSWKQRKRWSKGMLQGLKLYKGKLAKKLFKNKNLSCLDFLGNFSAPIIQVLASALTVVLIIFRIAGIELYDIFSVMYAYSLIFFLITYLWGVLINIYVVKYNKRGVKEALSGILLFVAFIFSWIPINIDAMLDKNTKWDPIKHKKATNSEMFNK